MKKILAVIATIAIVMSISLNLNGQDKKVKFGVKGGINVSNVTGSIREDFSGDALKNYTGFHAGIAVNIPLAFGFAIQPELLYTQNGTKLSEEVLTNEFLANLSVGSIQLPIGIQWGIKLGPVRPFIAAIPYIGYSLSHKIEATLNGNKIDLSETAKDYWNAFDYGVGLGAGIDIWKFQVAAKYNWALGNLAKNMEAGEYVDLEDFNKSKIAGLEISLAFLF